MEVIAKEVAHFLMFLFILASLAVASLGTACQPVDTSEVHGNDDELDKGDANRVNVLNPEVRRVLSDVAQKGGRLTINFGSPYFSATLVRDNDEITVSAAFVARHSFEQIVLDDRIVPNEESRSLFDTALHVLEIELVDDSYEDGGLACWFYAELPDEVIELDLHPTDENVVEFQERFSAFFHAVLRIFVAASELGEDDATRSMVPPPN